MTTITPAKLWFYQKDLEIAAHHLKAIAATMNTHLLVFEMQDLPPVIEWLEDLETIVNGLVATKETAQ